MIKQTKAILGIFKDGKLHTVVETPGATTFYSPAVYTHVEADDIETLMEGKSMPTVDKLKQLFHEKSGEVIRTLHGELELTP